MLPSSMRRLGSELGVLQAGFNEMMRGLNERERVRDIFGQYVGSEVAQKALPSDVNAPKSAA